MGRTPTKALGNPLCQARLEAAKEDQRLGSKEFASYLLNVSTSTLSDYELDKTKKVPPDVVLKMSYIYNAPDLRNIYCRNCPLGCDIPAVEIEDLDRITLKALSVFRDLPIVQNSLLDVSEKNCSLEKRQIKLEEAIKILYEIVRISTALKYWAEKYIGKNPFTIENVI